MAIAIALILALIAAFTYGSALGLGERIAPSAEAERTIDSETATTSGGIAPLNKYIENVAIKKLTATDIDSETSNQHEITGVIALQKLFGPDDLRLRGRLLYYAANPFSTDVDLTWYNADKTGPARYRLYYMKNPVIKAARPGDTLAVARYGKDRVLMIIAPQGTSYEAELLSMVQARANLPDQFFAVKPKVEEKPVAKAITTQLQQTGRIPIAVSLWKDVDSNEITVEGKVEKVKDGDTINLSGVFDIRLLGIDAPEHDQTCKVNGKTWNCGEEAAKFLTKLVLGKTVNCTNKKKEKYGRFLSLCTVDGKNINEIMIAEGLAVIYLAEDFAEAERQARISQRGLWHSEFINPEDFRRAKRR
ncbi:MAG: thermonuclease family protein [Alphaproteobacteria bacterium]